MDLKLFRMPLTAYRPEQLAGIYGLLGRGVATVEEAYDVVVLNSAPALALASVEQHLRIAGDVGSRFDGHGYAFVRLHRTPGTCC